jgi:hypothetical protein
MKHFDIDWAELAGRMPAWERLSQPARAGFLAIKPGTGARVEEIAPAAGELAEAGLVSLSPTGVRAAVAEEWRPFHVALRAMDRHRVWEAPSPGGLVSYLEDVFTTPDLQMLLGEQGMGSSPYPLRVLLADRVSAEEWVEGMLAAGTAKAVAEWERRHSTLRQWGQPAVTEPPAFADRAVLDAARRLLLGLRTEPAGVPLRDLPARFPDLAPATLGAALRGCLRYLLLFASMTDALEPTVGVWPEVAARVRLAAKGPPAPVEVTESWETAFGLEDMTTVLAVAAGEPLRLRADGAVFARTRQALEERLATMPEWAAQALGADPETRVESAVEALVVMDFAKAGGKAGTDLRLAATKKGLRWLDLPDRERLAALVAPVRGSEERSPSSWGRSGAKIGFFPVGLGFTPPAGMDLRQAVERAFLEMPPGGMLELGAFLEHQARAGNPFLGISNAPRVHWGRPTTRREWERLWASLLAAMVALRLAPLGGVRLGRTAEGAPAFALTPAGRYLLGADERLEYVGAGGEAAGVIVKPDFEIVFLGPAPGVEARVARFAERTGKGPGTMFRITRRSVLAAAEAGFTADRVLETLAAAAKHELPGNVARQLRDWFGATRRVRLRPAVLLECPDAETAARVRAAGGKTVKAVTDTLLELTDTERAARSALLKKLREAGVFADE